MAERTAAERGSAQRAHGTHGAGAPDLSGPGCGVGVRGSACDVSARVVVRGEAVVLLRNWQLPNDAAEAGNATPPLNLQNALVRMAALQYV
jgi:hypothetical protein